jgi:acetyl-CoA acetyltransferase
MNARYKKAAIVGIGETKVGKVPGISSIDFHIIASLQALEDAGLNKNDIDGLICFNTVSDPHPRYHIKLAEQMGLFNKRICDSLMTGGASPCYAIELAEMAISSNICNTILITSGDALLSNLSRDSAIDNYIYNYHDRDFEATYGPTIPTLYALVAERYFYEYGATSEQLATVAVTMRKHASLNPKAQMRELITMEDVLNSKMISSPLHLLDCSLISDGGGAVIVTSAERAKDLKKAAVYVLGTGQAHSYYHMGHLHSLTNTVCKMAGETAFRRAGFTPKDIDIAMIYDSFTITLIISLEDLGFCKKGEGAEFVQNGRIELNGELPINTHGGLLSYAHPGVPGGIFHLIEAVRQLRGEAGSRQVKEAKIALVHNASAVVSNHTVAILGREG